jgi:hypothetical protein
VQVYAYDDASKWVEVAADQYNAGEAPTLLYEEKLSTEAIDVLRFSPGDNMLAAGSHDNFVYVLGKTKVSHAVTLCTTTASCYGGYRCPA